MANYELVGVDHTGPDCTARRISDIVDLSDAFLECLCGTSRHNQVLNVNSYRLITEKPPLEPSPTTALSTAPSKDKYAVLASQIIDIIRTAPRPSPKGDQPSHHINHDLTPLIEDSTPIRAEDWTSYLAERVLRALEETIKHVAEEQETWGEALRDAYAYAVQAVQAELSALWEYTKEHPYETVAMVLLTVLALGVLARLVPVFVRVLGFAKEGPLEGSFAAWWQSSYKGYVPKGSLWSFLQRMGMTWD
ncbi:hypothetical protein B0J18DRAFT_484731 [Chaetomium sp. MPI-SDFR-AT-0129]|nr:hypothetical protein B0J18DRAFT_484731 [Chaetomium sp. MPI-SDFR-AT-0129]